ncbi:ABC transporter substrate-binding protein [Breznakiella homolactica]|uniref:Sugar ABC transporter substrate-binding protein n=1 Tax=Breznakiella homolactica TaxID=2798577 RepID=A0A7T7XLS1_9SPIR|nr:sugar ABC transporter substrate-binding protein [Breznakiella homolactica]QQO08622.1 sugar ABC transporter substrate-binding protein [Breznakiella homolactica]
MKKSVLLSLIMAVGLIVPMVFAGGTSDASKASSQPKSGTLKIWSMLTQTERAAEFENLALMYEAANPGVKVEITVMPWTGAMDKVVSSIMAGNPPDITVCGNGWPQTLAGTGGIMELSKLIDAIGGKQSFLGTSLNLGTYEDGYYAIPLYVTPYVTYYRESWLKEAGITKLPATWEEYYDMCKAVTNPAKNRYGFGIPLGDLHGWKTIWTLLQSNGVDLINVDAKGNWYVDVNAADRAAIIEVYNYLFRLIRDCSPAGTVSYTQTNVRELVAQGTIMSRIDTPEIYYNVRAMDPEHLDDVSFFSFPGRKTVGSGLGWVGLNVLTKGNTDLASDFIRFIFEGNRMVDFYTSYPYAMFPAKSDMFENRDYQAKLPDEIKILVPDMALEILDHATGLLQANGPFPGAGEAESRSVLGNPLSNMLIRGISAEQAADQLIAELKSLIE